MRGAEGILLYSLLLAGAVCEAMVVKPALKHAMPPSGTQHAGHTSRTGHVASHKGKQPIPGAAEVSTPQLNPGDTTSGDRLGRPTHPGCWMKVPSGCPKLPMRIQTWRHDTWAEQQGLDERGCLRRKRTWNKYCETDDVDMLYISSVTTKEGISALQIGLSDDWPKWLWPLTRGVGGAQASDAAPPAATGAQAAGAAQPAGAGADAAAEPKRPGCYMRMPSGCPKQPMRTLAWRSDQWADQNKLDEAGCMERKITWDAWCGAEDAQMLHVPNSMSDGAESESAQSNKAAVTAPPVARDAYFDELIANPSEPGCYLRMPSRCPAHPMRTQAWRHDTWAEEQDLDEESCKERKQTWDKYCESADATVLFVPKQ